MLQEFIDQTKSLISRSDIRLHTPVVMPVKYHEDGTKEHTLDLSSYMNSSRISQNFILNVILFFGILDTYVDSTNPSVIGKSYAEKLRLLPNRTQSDSVLNEVFRIYKLIRNATIHNASSITKDNAGTVLIQYQFRNTQHEIEISSKGLELLNSITYEFISPFEPRSVAYSDVFRFSLLTALRAEIKRFNDENGSLNALDNTPFPFKYLRRYRPQPLSIDWGTDTLTILNPYDIPSDEVLYYGVDYEIMKNGYKYLIPGEALINGRLQLDQLSTWRLN
ncbi:hypothetical protein [Paenibacillus silagei]|uniref:Apea-like HEPN domain-containing protein n=1 Tax=Paenibacillus silagei TaxID=1670801 RepID=A0ABS4NVI7_9BACL|nr:hypothetical protein [Paenibacillus silagei]MBP2113439.1 hypothetical protein [Paenibacillus silagei]